MKTYKPFPSFSNKRVQTISSGFSEGLILFLLVKSQSLYSSSNHDTTSLALALVEKLWQISSDETPKDDFISEEIEYFVALG